MHFKRRGGKLENQLLVEQLLVKKEVQHVQKHGFGCNVDT